MQFIKKVKMHHPYITNGLKTNLNDIHTKSNGKKKAPKNGAFYY
jgi:hypothetical protein